MNKKGFLIISLLFSATGIFAEQPGSVADLENSFKNGTAIVGEAIGQYAEITAERIQNGDITIADIFTDMPEEFGAHKAKIFDLVMDYLEQLECSDNKQVVITAAGNKALLNNQKEDLLNPKSDGPTKWQRVSTWANENQETLKYAGIMALVFIAGRASAPAAPTAQENAEATRGALTGDAGMQVDLIAAINAAKDAILDGAAGGGGD